MPSLSNISKQLCGRFSFILLFLAQVAYAQKHVEIIKNSERITLKEVIEQTEAYYETHDKGKGSGYKAFKRWEYFHRLMMDENEDVKSFDLKNYNEVKARRQREKSDARVGGPITAGSWQQIGPMYTDYDNYSGRVNTVVVDPANVNYIYAGSPAGGLWHSRDGGKTWKCITDNILSFLGITSVVIDPKSPVDNRTLYIVTGDKDNADTNYVGFFRSADNGNTWAQMPYQWNYIAGFDKLMMHPTDNTILYALAVDVGIMRYTVGSSATQWSQVLPGSYTDMEFNPTNPNIVYASGSSGTFYSTNAGVSWTKSSSTIPTSARNEVAVTPADPNIVYLYIGQREVASLYKSIDAGRTYSKIPTTKNLQDVALYQWRYNLTIAVSPTNANTLWIGGVELYRSTDGGVNWNYDNMGHVDYHSLDFAHGYLYAGNDGGVTRRAAGSTGYFEDLSQGLPIGQIYKFGIDPTSTDHVLAGFQDNGTASIVNGVAFTVNGGDGMECFVDPLNPNTFFTSTQFGDFYRGQRNAGGNILINPPLGPRMWLTPFKMDPLNSKVIYVGYGELWKNTMQGDGTWINTTNGALGSSNPIINFEIAPSNSNYIYVCKNEQVYVTKNGGASWTLLTHPSTRFVTNIAIHSEDPSTLWIASPYVNESNKIPRVLKSIDAGTTWTDVSGSLPFIDMLCLVYQRGSANGIYVGTSQGVFYKDDTLPDWIRFDYNLPYSPITELEINYKNQKVYASTYGRGLWASPLYKTSQPVACEGTGTITREVWTNVTGTNVTSIPLSAPPNATSTLTIFEAPSSQGSNFGARLRGYICPPTTGSYTFWISSDDQSELYLSGDENPANKRKIASVTGYTTARQWTKYTTQQSLPITLQQGIKYYIEVLHKEASGADHLAVGWQLPYGTLERPITGNRLIPFVENIKHPPTVSITSPQNGEHFHDTGITVTAEASDIDGDLLKLEIFEGATKLNEDFTAPFSFNLFVWDEGPHEYRVVAIDREGLTASDTVNFTTTNPSFCQASGTIARQVWNNITGTSVANIPVDSEPTFEDELTIFESPDNIGSNFGQRFRGMLCVPQTGYYTFWIASDDKSELYLNHEDPFTPSLIASVSGYTSKRQWEKYPVQKSQPIYLEKGSAYLIEALHKEGSGADHLAVGWQLPDGTLERPIPGSRLSPYEDFIFNNPPDVWIYAPEDGQQFNAPATIDIDIDAYDDDGEVVQVDLYINDEFLVSLNDGTYEYRLENVSAGTYRITAYAFDDRGDSNSAEIVIEVKGICIAEGSISHERWDNVIGTSVGTIPVNTQPNYVGTLSKFEIPSNIGSNYASRVRGYVCVPSDGEYVFYISSDDNSELWLSTDANPGNVRKIAYISGHTPVDNWIKYPSQTSQPIQLSAGQQYYIEAIHKEGSGVDHLKVGWQLPDGTLERPIQGTRLSPFGGVASIVRPNHSEIALEVVDRNQMHVYPNPNDGRELNVELPYDQVMERTTTTKLKITTTAGSVIDDREISCVNGCTNFNVQFVRPLASGIYIVEALVENKRYRSKLIVE